MEAHEDYFHALRPIKPLIHQHKKQQQLQESLRGQNSPLTRQPITGPEFSVVPNIMGMSKRW